MSIDLSKVFTKNNIGEFVDFMWKIQNEIGFKVSSRGWGYIMEQNGIITKDQFDKAEALINRCRKRGWLPVDFVAEDGARRFDHVHQGTKEKYGRDHSDHIIDSLDDVFYCSDWYDPDWWEGEDYYLQMIVEKIDLVTLFSPVCKDYHIPIANAKGWSSISQRAEYAMRFKKAEERGLKCVLLYCGDHDPDGLRISNTIRKNLEQIKNIRFSNGNTGYDSEFLEIKRFGLNYDFISDHNLTWIDNLITGSGKNLADPRHKNFNMPYLQDYMRTIGERKCEANALVTAPEEGKALCEQAITYYIGNDALERFEEKKAAERSAVQEILDKHNVEDRVRMIIKDVESDESE